MCRCYWCWRKFALTVILWCSFIRVSEGEVDKMLSILFQEYFLNKIARSLKRLQNILMSSQIATNKMQSVTIYFFYITRFQYFRRFFRPTSGTQNYTYSVRCLSDQYLTLYVQFWTPDDGRNNRLKYVDGLAEINKLWNFASCRLYSANILRIYGPMNVIL
jgi:hypothetical protein